MKLAEVAELGPKTETDSERKKQQQRNKEEEEGKMLP